MRTLLELWLFTGALMLMLMLIGASVAAAASPSVGVTAEAASTSAAPAAVQRVTFNNTGMRDEAAMVLVGTMLIGLAGAVRRAA